MKQEQSPQFDPNTDEPNPDAHPPRKRLENLQILLANSMNQLRALANSIDDKKLIAKINRFELELSTALESVLEESEIEQTTFDDLQYALDSFVETVQFIVTKFKNLETLITMLSPYITEESNSATLDD